MKNQLLQIIKTNGDVGITVWENSLGVVRVSQSCMFVNKRSGNVMYEGKASKILERVS